MNIPKNLLPREDRQAIIGVVKYLISVAFILIIIRYWYFNFL